MNEPREYSNERKSVWTCTWNGTPKRRASSHATSPVSKGSCAETMSGRGRSFATRSASRPYQNADDEFVGMMRKCADCDPCASSDLRENAMISSSPNSFAYASWRTYAGVCGYNIPRLERSAPICSTLIYLKARASRELHFRRCEPL